ncbi:MAG: hypothetical protein OXC92_00670 [Flavobacteriaceae bacterium]|nr:hypothetical protein [Flavobacteriaceae bacterium]
MIHQNNIGFIPSKDLDLMLHNNKCQVGLFYDENFHKWEPTPLYFYVELVISACIKVSKSHQSKLTDHELEFINSLIDDNVYLNPIDKQSFHTVVL